MLVMGSTQMSLIKLCATGPSTIQETTQSCKQSSKLEQYQAKKGCCVSKERVEPSVVYMIQSAYITDIVIVIRQV